jgi:Carboxypeptidase regulatory-like domain
MRSAQQICCVALLAVVLNVTAYSQAATSTADLRGVVADENGAVIPNAAVILTNVAIGATWTTTTEQTGQYSFIALPPGDYELRVESTAANFAPTSLRVTLSVGQQANLPIQLTPKGIEATVAIIEGAEVVETSRTQQSSVVGNKQITALPLSRRSYLDFAQLTPGVTDSDNISDSSDFRVAQRPQSGLSFGGNNGRLNLISVDGGEITDSSGGVIQPVSQEAVKEFQVSRNSFNAEFGRTTAGIVSIVSKSGTNVIRGSAFGLFRDDRFDAREVFDRTPGSKAPFSRQQYGGSVGFPIRRDRTFMFMAAERFTEKDNVLLNLLTNPAIFQPTASQTALLNYLETGTPFATLATALRSSLTTTTSNYPRTVSLFTGASGRFPFNSRETIFSARVDHKFSTNDTAYARASVSGSTFENRAAGALTAVSRGRTLDSVNASILLSETHVFSVNTINEARAQFLYNNFDVIPNDTIGPELNIEGFGNFGRDLLLPAQRWERHFDIADNVTHVTGNHSIKFGGSFNFLGTTIAQELFFGGRFNFGANISLSTLIPSQTLLSLNAFLAANRPDLLPNVSAPMNALQAYNFNRPSTYQQGFGDSTLRAPAHRYGFYAQDTWRPRLNLSFNYGLRYSLNNEPFSIPIDKNDLQPRVGFAWDPFANGKSVIRGGFGVFHGYVINAVTNATRTLAAFGEPGEINIILATPTSTALGLPSSFTVYQSLLLRTNNFSRTATAADLAALGVVARPAGPLEVRFRLDPNYKTPESYQASLGAQQDLGHGFSLELAYLFTRGLRIPRNRDINQFKQTGPPSTLNPNGDRTFIRFPNATQMAAGLTSDFRVPSRFQANQYESTANSFYHGGTISLTRAFANNVGINIHYTYSKTIDEVTDFNSDFSAQNPLNVRSDRAVASFDQRHRAIFSGTFQSPIKGDSWRAKILRDFVFSTIFIAGSARPFNLLLGFDANGDGRSQSDRPGPVGRNTGRGESFYNLDVRLARRFKFTDSRYLELTIDSFNVLNHTNLQGINNIVGGLPLDARNALASRLVRGDRSRTPTEPLGFTSAFNARQLQFGVRFNF